MNLFWFHKLTFLQLKSQLTTDDLFCSGPLLSQNQKLLRAISLLTKSSNQSQAYRQNTWLWAGATRKSMCVCVLTLSKTTLGAWAQREPQESPPVTAGDVFPWSTWPNTNQKRGAIPLPYTACYFKSPLLTGNLLNTRQRDSCSDLGHWRTQVLG